MVTAEELIVAIKSEGVGETREDLEGVEESMEDTADTAGDSAEELEGFTQRIQGAMSAAAAGVAVAAGALLTQIPIIGEFAAGLGAIFDALGLQVDQLIRDLGGGGLTDVLFTVAGAINDLDGTAADVVGALTAVATVVAGAALGVAAWAVKVKGAVGAASAFVGALKTAGAALAGIIGGITATTAALAVAVAAIVAFAAAYLTNFRGVRDTTNRILGDIKATVISGVRGFIAGALDALGDFTPRVRAVLGDVAARVESWAGDLARDAVGFGKDLINGFLRGIRSAIGRLRDFLGDLRDVGATVGVDVPSVGGVGGGGGGGGTGRPRPSIGNGSQGGNIRLDGRRVSEDTGRYRSDPSRRRGI